MRYSLYGLWFVWTVLIGPCFGACQSLEQMPVLVSILPQKYFVERIADPYVLTTVLIEPGRSPETYEPTAKQMELASKSRIYFRIGVPFEEHILPALKSANPSLLVVNLQESLADQSLAAEDPHIWTNPLNVEQLALIIRNTFNQIDQKHKEHYDRQFEAFSRELDKLDQDISNLLSPLTNRRFMVFHPAWGHFAGRYNLQQLAIERHGKSPTVKEFAELIKEAKKENIKVVLIQKQNSRHLADRVAKQINAKVEMLDPLAEDYLVNLRHVAETLRASLE